MRLSPITKVTTCKKSFSPSDLRFVLGCPTDNEKSLKESLS